MKDAFDRYIQDEKTFLNDIKNFKATYSFIRYPLWINNYLIVVPREDQKIVEFYVKNELGCQKDGCFDTCEYEFDNIIKTARNLLNKACFC